MAYTVLADVKEYLSIPTGTTSDDDLITDLIGRAQAYIDSYTGYTFEAAEDSDRTFDAVADVDGAMLHFDTMIAAITTVTNGDSVEVTSGQYTTEPRNVTPYYAIRLLSSSGVSWTYSTDPEDAITVTGKWAWSTTAPSDIVQACVRLVAFMYRQKDTSADVDRPLLTGDGNVIMPSALPTDVKALLSPYRRLV
jgi:hypothetical protein